MIIKPTSLATQSKRPSDVFKGPVVRRKFVLEALDIIREMALSHRIVIEGTMISSSERNEWTLPKGIAVKTASFWGRPSSLYVEGEEARASIMKSMGIDLRRSRLYRKYLEG